MEKILKFKKNRDCYDICYDIEECFNDIINNNFKSADATLKEDITVLIKITSPKN